MKKYLFKITGMDCAEEVALLKKELGPLVGGENNLSFDILNGKMTVNVSASCDETTISQVVGRTGMKAIPWEQFIAKTTHPAKDRFWKRRGRAVMCIISGAFLLVGFISQSIREGSFISALAGIRPEGLITVLFYLCATIAGAWFIAPKALFALRRLRPDMNLLMTIAAIGAMVLGEWFEAATVTFLFSVALLLESWSVGRARRAIGALIDLAPLRARTICPHDGDIEEKPVEEVLPGAIVIVRPGEKIPLDGIITKGFSTVNQAPITGESAPIRKKIGDEVFGGTINNEGAFEFKVTRAANDTTLARIIHMVEEAQSRRAPSEQWVEKFARYYTPTMMGLAVFMAVFHPLVFDGDWVRWFYEALVVLVIACPCALVISTPVSIVAGLTSAARAGVLIKGGIFLESPARIKAIALDKTGTLTYGHPEVQEVIPLSGHTPPELLSRVAALERLSEHPLAQAILRKAENDGVVIPAPENFQSIKGKGAEAHIDGKQYWIGSHRLMHERGGETPEFHSCALQLEKNGHSVVAIGNDNHICGLISIADGIREQSIKAVRDLKQCGVEHIIMLTGDNEGTAQAVAAATGISEYRAELLPQDKVRAVEELVARYNNVAMVGDGVNDAPAMAAATLGIAMGTAGADAAIETADIALISDDLSRLPWLINHSRRVLRIIKQNIWFALGLKALFLGLAIAGLATLWMAIMADMGASLLVIFNSLRLLDAKTS
ncbi:MAG: heavy metal translocating P-type ATPase [candidate division Zixibacteria bacterium]|nr:heavy metal translocating P-type ATPase [candidate division Zixibacteria bacterium]